MTRLFVPRRSHARPTRAGQGARARRTQRGWACVLFVVAMLLSHSARLAHLLLVQHVICEHGQLVHGPEAEAEAASSKAGAEERREQTAERDTSSCRTSEHEHCDAPSILHRPLAVQATVADAQLLSRGGPETLTEQREIRALSPIDLAPKGSPPRG